MEIAGRKDEFSLAKECPSSGRFYSALFHLGSRRSGDFQAASPKTFSAYSRLILKSSLRGRVTEVFSR